MTKEQIIETINNAFSKHEYKGTNAIIDEAAILIAAEFDKKGKEAVLFADWCAKNYFMYYFPEDQNRVWTKNAMEGYSASELYEVFKKETK